MKYNIEKINRIAKELVEIVEEGREGVRIGDREMRLRETGQNTLKCFSQKGIGTILENAETEVEAENVLVAVCCNTNGDEKQPSGLSLGKRLIKERSMRAVREAKDMQS